MESFIISCEGGINDQNLQAIEFWNYAVDLRNALSKAKFSSKLYLPKRVSDYIVGGQRERAAQEQAAQPVPSDAVAFDDGTTVMSHIRQSQGVKVLFVVGHGGADSDGHTGTVILCGTGTKRSLKTADVHGMQDVVYIGLHCHARSFTQSLTKPCFHLTGTDVGQNTDIEKFVRVVTKDKDSNFSAALNQLAMAELPDFQANERDEFLDHAREAMEKVAAATDRKTGKPGTAGVMGKWKAAETGHTIF